VWWCTGAEGILRKEELLQQLVELLDSPLLPVAKCVALILLLELEHPV
jgi:hypothetical protein